MSRALRQRARASDATLTDVSSPGFCAALYEVYAKETQMMKRTAVTMVACLLALGTGAFADEGKEESGKGQQRQAERKQPEGQSSYFRQHGNARIPNGHMPPPGECRIWYPDRPAGHQPPPFKCSEARGRVEPGGWLISPGPQRQELEVAVYDGRRPGIVIDVGIFDARTGSMIRVVGTK